MSSLFAYTILLEITSTLAVLKEKEQFARDHSLNNQQQQQHSLQQYDQHQDSTYSEAPAVKASYKGGRRTKVEDFKEIFKEFQREEVPKGEGYSPSAGPPSTSKKLSTSSGLSSDPQFEVQATYKKPGNMNIQKILHTVARNNAPSGVNDSTQADSPTSLEAVGILRLFRSRHPLILMDVDSSQEETIHPQGDNNLDTTLLDRLEGSPRNPATTNKDTPPRSETPINNPSASASVSLSSSFHHYQDHNHHVNSRTMSSYQNSNFQTPNTLLVLAIPSLSYTPQDFLELVRGAGHLEGVSHCRMIMDSMPNRYMMLLKFHSFQPASQFFLQFNGRPFNSFEMEICHVVWIRGVEVVDGAGAISDGGGPFFPHDYQKPSAVPELLSPSILGEDGSKTPKGARISLPPQAGPILATPITEAVTKNAQDSRGPLNLLPGIDNSNLVEMPTCPVCLDRMDSSVTGLFTSLCHHTFHCSCIMKWGDTTCPVCRFNSSKLFESDSTSVCQTCSSNENLWMCLVCAHVGCGRYISAHARQHFEETNHVYSLELETQRVWDYGGDGYVHRLIQNSDGKMVHLPPPSTPDHSSARAGLDTLANPGYYGANEDGFDDGAGGTSSSQGRPLYTARDIQLAEKLEGVGVQYHSHVSTLRAMHERQLQKVEVSSIDRMNHLESIITALEEENGSLWVERKELRERCKQSLESATKVSARLERVMARLTVAERKAEEESLLNSTLLQNHRALKLQCEDKDGAIERLSGEVADLKDQVRDIMFFLETREKVGVVEGIEDASIVIPPPPPPSTSTPKKNKKKNNKT